MHHNVEENRARKIALRCSVLPFCVFRACLLTQSVMKPAFVWGDRQQQVHELSVQQRNIKKTCSYERQAGREVYDVTTFCVRPVSFVRVAE